MDSGPGHESLYLPWFLAFLQDRAIRKLSPHTAKAYRQDFAIHSYATGALKAGINPKVVSERIGHANVGFFLQTHARVVRTVDRDAAEQPAALLIGDGWDFSKRSS